MEFGILGPLEVRDGARVMPLTGTKQRALLALLLLHANEVVSSERILDQLWGDEPPESGLAALRVRVSQLRKALEGGSGLLVTKGSGYLLELEPEQLDLRRFERLLNEADASEPTVAAVKLREALALWRGSALSEFAYESFAQAAIGRLEELRLTALEKRIEADLVLGRDHELVAELEELVAEHPLRERLSGQLILALYRSGRQAEALQVYQQTRRVLVEEIGIEPSPALQHLEKAILRQDPALERAGEPPMLERSILVVPLEGSNLDALLGLAGTLAKRPPRELVVAQPVAFGTDLSGAAARLNQQRERLLAEGIVARAAAFTSAAPGTDVLRIASELDVELLLVDAPDGLLEDATLVTMLEASPCDVGVLVRREQTGHVGPVLVAFAGADHDWAAVELGAWIARAQGVRLVLAGPVAGNRDASRLLARASLAVQRALGVAAEPLLVEPGTDGLLRAAEPAGLAVCGLSDRWRQEGLGQVRMALTSEARPPVVLVHRGLRPGGLAPRDSLTRFTWSLRS